MLVLVMLVVEVLLTLVVFMAFAIAHLILYLFSGEGVYMFGIEKTTQSFVTFPA